MITFKENAELSVVVEFDEEADNIVEEQTEVFLAGEPVDAEIVDEMGDYVDLQFGDGTVALGVLRSLFEVIDEKKE